MGKRKTEQRIKAIELHKQGFSRRQIAERVGVSQDTVKTWIALYKNRQKDLLEDRPHTKSYSQKLKIAAVQAHIREGKTIAEATALYGISDTSLLRRWCREYRETGCVSFSKLGRPSSKSQLCKAVEYHKRAFALQVSHNLRHTVFGRYGNQHMDMVCAKIGFKNFDFFPLAEGS